MDVDKSDKDALASYIEYYHPRWRQADNSHCSHGFWLGNVDGMNVKATINDSDGLVVYFKLPRSVEYRADDGSEGFISQNPLLDFWHSVTGLGKNVTLPVIGDDVWCPCLHFPPTMDAGKRAWFRFLIQVFCGES